MTDQTRQLERYLNVLLSRRNGGRFGYPRFPWHSREMQSQIDLPNFRRLEGESDESWSTRAEGEQKKFIESFKVKHNRKEGESKKESLERLDQGHVTLKVALAKLSGFVNSETQPLEWKSYLAFKQKCYEQYVELVKSILVSEGFREAPEKPYDPADHAAVLALGRLKSTAVHGEYYARNICERLAKAWANGEHRPTFRKLKPEEKYPLWEQRQNELKATGVTIEGGLNDFESCFYTFKDLPAKLTSSFNEAEARQFSKNYGSVRNPLLFLRLIERMLTKATSKQASHEFRCFVQRITTGLNKENVRRYLGKPYKELFEGLLEHVEVSHSRASVLQMIMASVY